MLASSMGRQFERRWFAGQQLEEGALAQPDFSSTTDLYSIAANAYGMRIIPLGPKDIIPLAVATLAPFVPLALAAVPLDVILDRLGGLFL
jgi:hypothetical protein